MQKWETENTSTAGSGSSGKPWSQSGHCRRTTSHPLPHKEGLWEQNNEDNGKIDLCAANPVTHYRNFNLTKITFQGKAETTEKILIQKKIAKVNGFSKIQIFTNKCCTPIFFLNQLDLQDLLRKTSLQCPSPMFPFPQNFLQLAVLEFISGSLSNIVCLYNCFLKGQSWVFPSNCLLMKFKIEFCFLVLPRSILPTPTMSILWLNQYLRLITS